MTAQITRSIFANSHSLSPSCVSSELFTRTSLCCGSSCVGLTPSLRIPLVLQECYLESDQTSLYHAAKGLMTLQALYGTIPQIFGKGDCARVRLNKCILFFGTALRSVWLNAPLGFFNPAITHCFSLINLWFNWYLLW